MTVKELIEALDVMPDDADVFHLWDGEPRTRIKHVWLSRDGRVITADDREVCYDTGARPEGAPTREENNYWESSPIYVE